MNTERAFAQLRASLATAPVPDNPDPKHTLILDADASNVGLGAVLSERRTGQAGGSILQPHSLSAGAKILCDAPRAVGCHGGPGPFCCGQTTLLLPDC